MGDSAQAIDRVVGWRLALRGRALPASPRITGTAVGLVVGVAAGAAIGYAPIPSDLVVVLTIGLAVAVPIVASPRLAAIVLGVSLPELQDVTGGHLGLNVVVSDIVLVLIGARLFATVAVSRRLPALRALRPVRVPVAQYMCLIVVLLVVHASASSAIKSGQRRELFALPILAGAYIALRRNHMVLLRGYVLATTVLAAIWPALNAAGLEEAFQKNPTGQLITNAILLLVGVKGLRRLLPCMPILVVGLALTASRGAIVALAVGIIVLSFTAAGRSRRVLLVRTAGIAVVAVAMYQWLPTEVTSRLSSYTVSGGSAASAAVDIRILYAHAAEQVIAAHPWLGIGVGNYLTGEGTFYEATDPHDVVLLEAAEGGYIFAASFILLVIGSCAVLWRLRRIPLAPVGLAILAATAAHGLVDVYWVRGTPVLGWLLVGMVCGCAAQRLSPPVGPGAAA